MSLIAIAWILGAAAIIFCGLHIANLIFDAIKFGVDD